MTNKKLQLWALGIAGYNCKVEYIAGTANSCANLLSRIPTKSDENNHVQEQDDVDFDDKAYEVGTLNSNSFDSRRYASCHLDEDNDLVKPDIDLPGEFSMEAEQAEDEIIASLKKRLQSGTATKTEDGKHMIIDNLVYYLSNADNEPTLRIYVPKRLKSLVIKQDHDLLGHMSTDKRYDTMRLKYYFPNMYKELYKYVDQCVTCQTRSYRTSKPPLWKRTFHHMRLPGLGLTYLARTQKHCQFPRYRSALQLLTDNGTEFVNESVRETLEALNIHHVTTSYYSPQGNDDDESSDVETSKAKMTKWARYEREDWSSEDDIPLMEFKKGLENFSLELSQDVQDLDNFVRLYAKFDRSLTDLHELIGIARDYLQHLKLQLNMLSLGHLSPSVIRPTD
ncbi:unnamed protein product [Mytilus edulis]|uniref:Integrase zinc-binding domain-containing protein n=1 Tax=Mytilus edulis TaxID=6550 RepID=A0A8S3T0T9_MYTED|nr:unnamed protein product [Mytilus edulis]